jgi:predicted Zn-dependent peptidase
LKIRPLAPLLALLLAAPALGKPKPAPAAPAEPETIDAPRRDDPMGVTITRLPNGLTVYLSPNKGQPRVSAWIATRAGSKNDPADSTGMAHYLEHMMFKGTPKLGTLDYAKEAPHLEKIRALYEARFKTADPAARAKIDKLIDAEDVAASAYEVPNEISKFYRTIGGRGLNAFTSDEETVFHVDLPANRLEAWAAVEAERFEHPVFRLFPTELEAVYEEKNRSLDNASAILGEELEKDLYKSHPYGIPTLGTVAHLKNPSLTKMYEFHDTWYVPNNMAIALSGDFDRAQALEIVRRHFGAWPARPLPALPKWPLPKPKGVERHEVKYEAEEQVIVSWPTAAKSDADADALTILDMLMDNSAAGLMNLRLNQALKVKGSGSYPEMRNDAGNWNIWAVPKKDQTLEEAEALLMQTVDALKNGEFDDEDLAAVVTDFEISEKRRLESNEARDGTLVESFVSIEPWERAVGRLDRLRRVTKDDVVRVARKYLGEDRVVVYRRNAKPEIPRMEKPNFTKLDIDPSRRSAFLNDVLAIPAPPIEPRWLVSGRDYQAAPVSGGRLYASKNPYNDLFTLTVREERGRKRERTMCEALDLLSLSGAGPYTADELKKKLYALGTSVSYSCDERTSAVSISGLDRNFWPSLELIAERFDWPNVSSGTLARLIDVDLGAREDEKRDPGAVHEALGELAQRGRESEVLTRLTNDELKKLDEAKLKSLIRDWPTWQRRVAYAGPRSAAEVAKLLEYGRSFKPTPPREPRRYLKPARTRLLFTHRAMAQAQVGFFAADEVFDPARYVDYQFYSQYMGGGMSSVIFQEVREARALAYSAGGGHSTSADKGDETMAYGYVGCQADKTPEAVELMLKLFRDFPSSTKRFEETAKAVEEGYRTNVIEYGAVPGALMDWEDQGLSGGDPRPARFERAIKYTLPEIETFAKRLADKPMTVWILGDRDHVGLDRLKTAGDLEEKELDALFPY